MGKLALILTLNLTTTIFTSLTLTTNTPAKVFHPMRALLLIHTPSMVLSMATKTIPVVTTITTHPYESRPFQPGWTTSLHHWRVAFAHIRSVMRWVAPLPASPFQAVRTGARHSAPPHLYGAPSINTRKRGPNQHKINCFLMVSADLGKQRQNRASKSTE